MGEMLAPKPTFYAEYEFRSRVEARWAMVFDELELWWEYEPQPHDLGLKHLWTEDDEDELKEALNQAYDEDERKEIRREAWWTKHEKRLYLPDFFLHDFDCWVEIKGQAPNLEEEIKARRLARQTKKPVHILWGYIPDPHAKTWGECSQVYGGSTGIIASFVLEFGLKAVMQAFTAARQARF
jgi:hypothetical protein